MAEGVAGAVEAAPKAAGSFFTHKLGPLPVWAWGLGIGGIIAAVLWYENQSNGAVSGGLQNALGAAGIGAPLDTGSAASPATNLGASPATPLTNATWLQQVLTGAANAAGVPLGQAQLYLQDYLNGTPPNLSGAAETAYQSVISNALALGGSAPSVGVAPTGTNPFGNNQTWFNEILSFLPSGTFEGESSAQIQQGLTNWINGVSTTLTQAEADALSQSQSIVGSAPNPVTFSIAKALSGTSSTVTTSQIGTTLSTIWNDFGSVQTSNPTQFASGWIQTAAASLNVPVSVATAAWNAIQANPNTYVSQLNYVSSSVAQQNLANLFNQLSNQYNANSSIFANIPTAALNLGTKNPNPVSTSTGGGSATVTGGSVKP